MSHSFYGFNLYCQDLFKRSLVILTKIVIYEDLYVRKKIKVFHSHYFSIVH